MRCPAFVGSHSQARGHVLRANFDATRDATDEDFDADRFEEIHEKYTAARRRAARARRIDARREFERWSAARRGRARALDCLRALQPPAHMAAEAGAAAALRYWRRIGGLLKAVDGGLLGDWVEWSQLGGNDSAAGVTRASDVFEWAQPLKAPASPANATAVWCALAPRGCDVSRHPSCGGVSALRASLVKVLGSSCDLASAFERLRKRLAASGGDVPPTVTALDLRRCCHEGGLALSREEARQLIDCIALRGQATTLWVWNRSSRRFVYIY